MIPVEAAISRFRRDLTVGALLNGLLAGVAFAGLFVAPFFGLGGDRAMIITGVAIVWIVLVYRSVRGSRLTADSTMLIAAGQFDEAEQRIEAALRSFSIFRTGKLLSLHHLALLRHAQRRWRETALLCRALLGQRLGNLQGISRPIRLILADSLLEMNDLRGAYDAMIGLYTQRLSLGEAMQLLAVQLDYESRVGAWESMAGSIATKSQMAELMGTQQSARTQAMLALAAKKIGRDDWSSWLRRRAEVLVEPTELVRQRAVLSELWEKTSESAVETEAKSDAQSNPSQG